MDALEGLSDDGDDTSSSEGGSGDGDGSGGGEGGEGGEGGSCKKQKAADGLAAPSQPPKKKELTLDDLEAAGFSTGPSVLFIKPPAEEQQSWNWSDGKTQKAEEAEETIQERRRTHEAATTGAEEGATLAMRAVEHAAHLREAQRAEREQLAAAKKQTWNQKEKRKRDEGKATKGRNFVEEEKRLQRQFGMYSGFD
ncbi:MAG: hypothetical protein J3K34DRAFT_165842 [Monoraphidium minutum]|nr:MAG: hypothetical protein J3K34DRAFT_165842 [Monoraphidium minutum]